MASYSLKTKSKFWTSVTSLKCKLERRFKAQDVISTLSYLFGIHNPADTVDEKFRLKMCSILWISLDSMQLQFDTMYGKIICKLSKKKYTSSL